MPIDAVDPLLAAKNWADSVYDAMTVDQRIGQLMMIRAHSDLGAEHEEQVRQLIDTYEVGALCFFQGTPQKQLELTNEYQSRSKIPMIVSMDAEWGLGMRLKESAMSFPKQLALGAIDDDNLIYEMGQEVGRQLRRIGVHLNFAPVVDVNNNKDNPVINTRSFGEQYESVAQKGTMYMLGMQSEGVIACAKHFPGHGDTDVDSHYDLPLINHDMNRLDSVELRPFHRLIARGVQSVMVAHLQVPALESRPNTPTTLSYNTVTNLLKEQMGFSGLIVTDAMEMQGVTKHYPAGEAEAKAIEAGNDMICLPRDVGLAMKAIKKYMAEGKIPENRLAESVKKILSMKYELGLSNYVPISTYHLKEDLFPAHAKKIVRTLERKSLTLARDEYHTIPIIKDPSQFAVLDIGNKQLSPFQERLSSYGLTDQHRMSKGGGTEVLLNKLAKKEYVVVAFHDMSITPAKRFGVQAEDVSWVNQLAAKTKVIVVVFGNPYALQYFDQINTAIVAYDGGDEVQDLTAQAIFGAHSFTGKLPVTASERSLGGMGESTESLFRLGFGVPEDVGLNSQKLQALDTLMDEIIDRKAAPGGQILVIKDGQVVFQKAYGYHTYDKKRKVENHHVYDLASVTKILASTYSLMKLFDEGKISVFRPIETYLPELNETNKKGIILEDMIIHSARLKPWIPFYKNTLNEKNKPSLKWYNKEKKEPFTIEVADKLYMHRGYIDSIWYQIYESELRTTNGYRYSDLGFYLADHIVERVTGKSVDQYAANQFYQPLGLQRTMYNPLEKIPRDEIAPTEEDGYFRYQRLQGHVHDMGAAMRGGVSGHAGLFSNAYEVGILMQTLLNEGYYGGKRYFHPVTVSLFTARPKGETRRGLGFDMKQLDPTKSLNMAQEASYKTYGHLGFTGTCVWADPLNNLVFVFLSNRTYPDMNNNLLGKDDYRPRLQAIIYNSLMN
jgi:beta-glucosidase-like glycosyl hydrolase/CubicO group peptidase (beta-lactamase class C family)